ncbi:flavin monoamine oxidase family protein [Chitinilyticum piscinae]|uniref:Tryptophan 2-monooxygenase n=1 Tax=Chitinilyticum piscinae TaxID=2866724 RepID=A0A8J7FZ83_9NEIS|nr:NAD(P)/FAD-dependent oxidoreductase [Chitinilyticum piscinae]MBE9608408.1 FAD-dependent oxidoreductase [Chitinilyticum piscinae]
MSVIARLRHDANPSHPYLDTPDFAYDQWLGLLGKYELPIGSVSGRPRVAVIGAGASGLCAAYELQRAGCAVSVFEADMQAGGRCASTPFQPGEPDLAELGAMRFPPSEFTLDYYFRHFRLTDENGIAGLPDFPDPGVVPTWVSYGGDNQVWQPGQPCPAGFEVVANGWDAFNKEGLSSQGGTQLQSPASITRALQAGDVALATRYWQDYLDEFGQISFYSFLYAVFTGHSRFDIPGGKAWSFADFDRFGALGLGSGGFGPLYPIGFNDIFRLLPNGLESAQKLFQPGIRQLPLAFAAALGEQCDWHYATPIDRIERAGATFTLHSGSARFTAYDRVIVATTTRAMEMGCNLSDERSLLSDEARQAIRRTHIVSSVKVAARIRKFWRDDPQAVRCLITDDALHQVYTLDYGAADTAVCFLSYTWDDDAVKQQALGVAQPGGAIDKVALYESLRAMLMASGSEPLRQWAEHLRPYGNPQQAVLFVEWQSSPYFNGGFKLAQPGQDPYVQAMFYDFQKAGSPDDTGVYLAGDCISWTSGWVEGALQAGLNAAAGVLYSLGGQLNPDQRGMTPLQINAERFCYFGSGVRVGQAGSRTDCAVTG